MSEQHGVFEVELHHDSTCTDVFAALEAAGLDVRKVEGGDVLGDDHDIAWGVK